MNKGRFTIKKGRFRASLAISWPVKTLARHDNIIVRHPLAVGAAFGDEAIEDV